MKLKAMRVFGGLALGVTMAAQAAAPTTGGDANAWTSWGNGLRRDNFSVADQINRSNVATLKPVWIRELKQHGGWEMTPIVVNGIMYVQDLLGNAFALDPETGKDIWRFSSGVRGGNRAVSYWPGDAGHEPRIIMAVGDRIYALDAATGEQIKTFGGGRHYIEIRDGFSPPGPSYRMSSPVTIYKNLLITGVSTQEFGSKGPPGDPRAYDAINGRLVWRFHIVPHPGEPNFGTWGGGWQGRSGPTTWGIESVDVETGLVFIPVGNPADNFVGTDRAGNDLYSDSIVALDATTGKYRWHYQITHHDLWDFDVAAPPALIDLDVHGKRVPALVEVTKQGLMFILDRRTGKPVFGVEERPVPHSTIPEEHTSPTQPFPLKPQPLARLGISRADITTITPAANRYCTDMWNRMGFRDAPIYTPPSLQAPLVYSPANAGGAGGVWGGVSVDPRNNYIFVNVADLAAYTSVVADDSGSNLPSKRHVSTDGYTTESAFTKWMDPNGMPCIQPPWGEMVAVDGNTGEIAWRAPLGRAEVYRQLGEHTGMINYGGSLATAGGLVFIGGITEACSQCKFDDPEVRAFDERTGLVLWHARLSAGTKSNLMTFMGKNGRQYVVATTSGRPDTNISIVAFALPRPGDQPVDVHPAPVPPSALGQEAAVVESSYTPISRVEDLPPGLGRADVTKVCTMCHSIGTVTAAPMSPDGWKAVVTEMRTRGAPMNDATAARIEAYLAGHFASR